MRLLVVGAFVLDGAAAVGFVAMMALGEDRVTPLDGLVLSALILGFVSALGSAVLNDTRSADETTALLLSGAAMFDRLPDAAKMDLRQHFPPPRSFTDPAQHLASLTQPSIDVTLAPGRPE